MPPGVCSGASKGPVQCLMLFGGAEGAPEVSPWPGHSVLRHPEHSYLMLCVRSCPFPGGCRTPGAGLTLAVLGSREISVPFLAGEHPW